MNISMFYIAQRVAYTPKEVLARLLEKVKEAIYEKQVPVAIIEKFKSSYGKLSLTQPPIEEINRHLESSINHLNNREELLQIKNLRLASPKYRSIRILEWYDTIEWYELKDRVFVVEIKTVNPLKQAPAVYNIRLSTLVG